MEIDAKSFFMLVATLGAGGVGGYVASEKHLLPPLLPSNQSPPTPPPHPAPSASASASSPPPAASVPPAPVCDDSAGSPGDCPPPGYPVVEGGCGSFAATRCAEFKQTMKAHVAENAVACLAKLSPHDRCNAQRVNLCAHNALMNACAEPEGRAGDGGASTLAATCQGLVASCSGDASVMLSPADCERTLSGLNAVGRDRMAACLKKHCADRGFLFCESVTKPD
jgi:hypothetical protein